MTDQYGKVHTDGSRSGGQPIDANGITIPAEHLYSLTLAPTPPPTICIKANDGRALLTIKPDGTVEGEIENASEAARLFVESTRGLIRQPDALREALDDAAIDEIILIFDRPREAMRAALQALAARGLEIREKNDE